MNALLGGVSTPSRLLRTTAALTLFAVLATGCGNDPRTAEPPNPTITAPPPVDESDPADEPGPAEGHIQFAVEAVAADRLLFNLNRHDRTQCAFRINHIAVHGPNGEELGSLTISFGLEGEAIEIGETTWRCTARTELIEVPQADSYEVTVYGVAEEPLDPIWRNGQLWNQSREVTLEELADTGVVTFDDIPIPRHPNA